MTGMGWRVGQTLILYFKQKLFKQKLLKQNTSYMYEAEVIHALLNVVMCPAFDQVVCCHVARFKMPLRNYYKGNDSPNL